MTVITYVSTAQPSIPLAMLWKVAFLASYLFHATTGKTEKVIGTHFTAVCAQTSPSKIHNEVFVKARPKIKSRFPGRTHVKLVRAGEFLFLFFLFVCMHGILNSLFTAFSGNFLLTTGTHIYAVCPYKVVKKTPEMCVSDMNLAWQQASEMRLKK